RVLLLVTLKRRHAGDEQAGAAAGTQARVYLVQRTGVSPGGQEVHYAPDKPDKKHAVLQGIRPVRALVRPMSIVQEHEIEIRPVRQFHSAKLAVSDDAESCRAQ